MIFEGDTYSESGETNFEIVLPESVSIQNVNLNGGGNDIVFTAPFGETPDYGSLDFVVDQLDDFKTITISSLGTINY